MEPRPSSSPGTNVSPPPRKPPSQVQSWAAAGAAFEMAGGVGAGCLIGFGLDRWLGWAPWGLIAGATLGSVLGFWSLVRLAMKKPPS